MNFEEFLSKQQSIYNNFEIAELKLIEEGFVPSLKISSMEGICIHFKHPLKISQRVEQFSKRISQQVPTLFFKKENIHTTIYFKHSENIRMENILEKFADILYEIRNKIKNPQVEYKRWLINQSSVIAAGYPNRDLFEILNSIYTNARRENIEFEFPWGTHITVNRFLKKGRLEKIPSLIKMIREEPPLGISCLESINLEYIKFGRETLNLKYDLYKRFDLKGRK